MCTSTSCVAAALLTVLAVVAGTNGPASARTIYDGVWSVVVAVKSGTCSGAYRYPLAIVNGHVRPVAGSDQTIDIYGRVGSGGRVSVEVRRGDLSAHGVGRLSRYAGAGVWRSPNGCAGEWEATRR
jgi:hypothetical protein